MENFFKIRAEKQRHIVNAGYTVFGKQGYKKASVADIAAEAGITKGMITYYFGSKKNLFLYLAEAGRKRLLQEIKERIAPEVKDFFQKMKIITEVQVDAIREYPSLISFTNSLHKESDPEVAEDIARLLASENAGLNNLLLENTDFSKFEPGIDPQLICKFIFWADSGFLSELSETESNKVITLVAEFYKCLDIMQKIFYRG